MLTTVRLDVCRPFSTLEVVKKPAFNWSVGRVLVWNSSWTEDAVCRSKAAATAAVILCCSCCNFSSLWCQERFKECLLYLQRNHWKLQQGKSTPQASMSFVLPTSFSWCAECFLMQRVSSVGHSCFKVWQKGRRRRMECLVTRLTREGKHHAICRKHGLMTVDNEAL